MKVKSRLLPALVVGMLAASTMGVAAQESESGASFFDVTMTPTGEPVWPEPGDSGPGWEGELGLADIDVAVDAGDARASGLLDQVRNGSTFMLPDGRTSVARSAVRLVNEQGSWVGEGTVTSYHPEGPPSHLAAFWRFEGEGAYDGLIYEIHSQGDRTQNPSTAWGLIYPAEAIPPQPEPIDS